MLLMGGLPFVLQQKQVPGEGASKFHIDHSWSSLGEAISASAGTW